MERRLAAILAADVVGFSRLMGADEAATLAALDRHREADRRLPATSGRCSDPAQMSEKGGRSPFRPRPLRLAHCCGEPVQG